MASQKKSKKPRRDSQQDSGPSKIPKTAMDEATSTPEPVEVSQKDPLPELSDGDAAGSAADIPDVPDSFTRAQQRKLRKDKVAAQRKRKHGEDEPEEAAGEWDEEEPEPCGRGRARGRGRGRGRGRSRGRGGVVEDDGDKPLRSLSRSRSPVVMKRPAAKGQVSTAVSKKVAEPGNKAKAASEVPKKAAGPKTKPRASSEVPKKAARPKTKPRAASEAASLILLTGNKPMQTTCRPRILHRNRHRPDISPRTKHVPVVRTTGAGSFFIRAHSDPR